MKSTTRLFSIIFILIVCLDLFVVSKVDLHQYRIFSKPLILGSLIWYYIKMSRTNNNIDYRVLMALVFSLIGDILLIYETAAPIFFIFGLFSFLLAHILYSIVFYKQRDRDRNPLGYIVVLLLFGGSFFLLINNKLNELLIPVAIYILTILTMVCMAFLRKKQIENRSYFLVVLGALLFMVSDGALAIDKFYSEFLGASQIIMITYAMAQFFIVIGLLKHEYTK